MPAAYTGIRPKPVHIAFILRSGYDYDYFPLFKRKAVADERHLNQLIN